MKTIVKPQLQEDYSEMHIKNAQEIFNHYTGKAGVLVDLGAHIGALSLLGAMNGFSFVASVEADLDNYQELLKNIILNKQQNKISPSWNAVYHTSGIKHALQVCEYNTGMRSVSGNYKNPSGETIEKVAHTISLEDILYSVTKDHGEVDLLKIDIEGTEYEIFNMNYKLDRLLKKVKYIDIECHVNIDGEWIGKYEAIPERQVYIQGLLKSLGFEVSSYGPYYHMVASR